MRADWNKDKTLAIQNLKNVTQVEIFLMQCYFQWTFGLK